MSYKILKKLMILVKQTEEREREQVREGERERERKREICSRCKFEELMAANIIFFLFHDQLKSN